MLATNWNILSTLRGPRKICRQARPGPGVSSAQSPARGPAAPRTHGQDPPAKVLPRMPAKRTREETGRDRRRKQAPEGGNGSENLERTAGRSEAESPIRFGKRNPIAHCDFVLIEPEFTYLHSIKLTILKGAVQRHLVHSQLCNHHLYLVPKHFHHPPPRRKLCPH